MAETEGTAERKRSHGTFNVNGLFNAKIKTLNQQQNIIGSIK